MDVAEARQLAKERLADSLPQRWQHVQAVAAEAERLAESIELDSETLVCAAWLHDIGYSPDVAASGFHPLDGARFLREQGWPVEICDLVAHHTCAKVEARERSVERELRGEFSDHPGPERDALWAADATTGPDGRRVTLAERILEVEQRYGAGHTVSRCIRMIRPELEAAIERTKARQPR